MGDLRPVTETRHKPALSIHLQEKIIFFLCSFLVLQNHFERFDRLLNSIVDSLFGERGLYF